MNWKMNRVLMVGMLMAALWSAQNASAQFVPVDFSSSHNRRVQTRNASFPEGDVTLGGVPFHIPTGGNNEWGSGNGLGGGFGNDGQFILDVPVGVTGATAVHTLISSDWGTAQSGRLLVEFFGSDGAHFAKDLVGNQDIRDWNLFFTNQINSPSTINVVNIPQGVNNNPDVMDMQTFILPDDFHDEVLISIRFTDNRQTLTHSALISGITAEVVPEPASLALLGAGTLLILRRRQTSSS